MKNWLTIGQFSKQSGFSAKALRLYEQRGLLCPHIRGENDYRYYDEAQLVLASRLKELKDLGFSLVEIKELLQVDEYLDVEKMKTAMRSRLHLVSLQSEVLRAQKIQIENILSSLDQKSQPLKAEQRRAIMNYYGKISILVTGCSGLRKTADFIQQHFKNSSEEIAIYEWQPQMVLPSEKPYILICHEDLLSDDDAKNIDADTVVIKNLSSSTSELQNNYLKLYKNVGPHVTTVINADDRASVQLAGAAELKKGRIFYFSKNRYYEAQIKHIGGILSDGDEVDIYGANLTGNYKLGKIMAYDDEIALLSSLGAVMTVGLKKETLAL